jgi:hypothetical protein
MLFIGDLPGFYGIGRIVLEGQGERLYDFSLQREIQNAYWPVLAGTFLPTMYPPFFAAVLAPFTVLPPKSLQLLAALGDLVVVAFVLRFVAGDRRIDRATLTVFSLPVFVSIAGAQTSLLAVLLIAMSFLLRASGRYLFAGIVCGCLMFKPQVGVGLCCVMAVAFGSRFFLGLVAAGVVQYLVGCVVMGGEWLVPWSRAIGEFAVLRDSLDGSKMTSGIPELLAAFGLGHQSGTLAVGIWILVCLAFCGWAALSRMRAQGTEAVIDALVATFPLFTPQVNFYDLSISLVWVCARIPLKKERDFFFAYVAIVVASFGCYFRQGPGSLVPLSAFAVGLLWMRGFTCRNS